MFMAVGGGFPWTRRPLFSPSSLRPHPHPWPPVVGNKRSGRLDHKQTTNQVDECRDIMAGTGQSRDSEKEWKQMFLLCKLTGRCHRTSWAAFQPTYIRRRSAPRSKMIRICKAPISRVSETSVQDDRQTGSRPHNQEMHNVIILFFR